MPRAPSPVRSSRTGERPRAPSEGVTPPSPLLRAHVPDRCPPSVFGFPGTEGLCRLLPAPAGYRPFPMFTRHSFPACPALYPGGFRGAYARFFPRTIGLRRVSTGSACRVYPHSDFRADRNFEASGHSFGIFEPAVLLATLVARTRRPFGLPASDGFYVRAPRGSLPPRAPVMLAVRSGQLTAGDFHPIGTTTSSAAPDTVRNWRSGIGAVRNWRRSELAVRNWKSSALGSGLLATRVKAFRPQR